MLMYWEGGGSMAAAYFSLKEKILFEKRESATDKKGRKLGKTTNKKEKQGTDITLD